MYIPATLNNILRTGARYTALYAVLSAAGCSGPASPGPQPNTPAPAVPPAEAPALATAPTSADASLASPDRPVPEIAAYPERYRPGARTPIGATAAATAGAPLPTPPAAPSPRERARLLRSLRSQEKKLAKAHPSDAFSMRLRLAENYETLAAWASVDGDRDARKQAIKRAFAHYKKLVGDQTYANHRDLDRALFAMATLLNSERQVHAARKLYLRLVRDMPTSKFIPDVYLAFGEYYFAENSMANAQKFYERVLQFKDPRNYSYALYKLAWVEMNIENYQRALDRFSSIVTLPAAQASNNHAALSRAAKNDMVMAYSYAGQPDKAYAFFARIDKRMAPDLLHRLGTLYSDRGQYDQAIAVRRQQLELQPERACSLQIDIALAVLSVGQRAAQVQALETLAVVRARTADDTTVPATERATCDQQVRTVLGETARLWHREWRVTRQASLRRPAMRVYELYVAHFPTSPQAVQNQYYLADLAWREARDQPQGVAALATWYQAAMAFATVLHMAPEPPSDAVGATVQAYRHTIDMARTLGGRNTAVEANARTALEYVIQHHSSHPAATQARALLRSLD